MSAAENYEIGSASGTLREIAFEDENCSINHEDWVL